MRVTITRGENYEAKYDHDDGGLGIPASRVKHRIEVQPSPEKSPVIGMWPESQFGPNSEKDHCSRFVVVIGSERLKSRTNGSTHVSCKWLRNIVAYTIFKTRQNRPLSYESAALTS